MELPPRLRQAVDSALEGVAMSGLAKSVEALSQRYRNEVRDDRLHLADEASALAYIAARMPATYASTRASLAAAADALPDFAPATALDVGAGPGTALWAAVSTWPGISDALLLEASPVIRAWGERLSGFAGPSQIAWRHADIRNPLPDIAARDLVMLAYVLDELAPEDRDRVVDRLWALTAGVLVIVEPGTPKGWLRILAARGRLLAAGAHIAAPCPHGAACPLAAPDWCHFGARVARSRIHRLAKDAEVPWEDEKFIYLAASRTPARATGARVIAPPQPASGRVTLKLCKGDGAAAQRLVSRREGAAFKAARRSDWGDVFEG